MKKDVFFTANMVCAEGHTKYYMTLQEAQQGALVRVKRGIFARPDDLVNVMIDIEKITLYTLSLSALWTDDANSTIVRCGD